MKLASFRANGQSTVKVGALVRAGGTGYLADVTAAYAEYLTRVDGEPAPAAMASARVPSDMLRYLEGGERTLEATRKAIAYIEGISAAPSGLARLEDNGILHRADRVRYLPPVPRPGKIISVGANYRAHVKEAGSVGMAHRPEWPPAFSKFPSVLIGHEDPIVYPRHTKQLDYEAELCMVIGTRCKDVPPERYLDVIAGFTIINDVSMREIQFAEMKTGLLLMGKNLDTAGPCGPFLATKDEIPDPQNVRISLRVNGEERQNESTSNMIFSLAEIVAYWSRMTLEPGDLFTTGSPAGVGIFSDNPARNLLHAGDIVEIEIEGIGVLRNRVISEEEQRLLAAAER